MGTPQFNQLFVGSSSNRVTVGQANDGNLSISTNVELATTQSDPTTLNSNTLITVGNALALNSTLNDLITTLQANVSTLSGEIDPNVLTNIQTIQSQLSAMPDLSTLLSNVTALQTSVSTIQTAITTLVANTFTLVPVGNSTLVSVQAQINGNAMEVFKFDNAN